MAPRANDNDGYKPWLALGIEQLGRDITAEVESELQMLNEMVQDLTKRLAQERAKS